MAEPEDEVLDLDGLVEATDEAEKSKIINSDVRVETLRGHLLAAVKAITSTYRGDAEVTQALADFLKACTNTNIATPLSLDPLALTDIVSHLIATDLDATWLSISSLLLFRLRKNQLSPPTPARVFSSAERPCLCIKDWKSEAISGLVLSAAASFTMAV